MVRVGIRTAQKVGLQTEDPHLAAKLSEHSRAHPNNIHGVEISGFDGWPFIQMNAETNSQ